MGLKAFSLYRKLIHVLAEPLVIEFFLRRAVGCKYGIGTREKLRLMRQIRRNVRSIVGATGYYEHLLLATHMLSIPPYVAGDVVECGCFKGRSTATLSLLCSLIDRRLLVFDSFEGLPKVDKEDEVHVTFVDRRYEVYRKGDFSGVLDEVRSNVAKYGSPDRCAFIKGYFEESLPSFSGDVCFTFLDVDLHASLRTCLLYLWPLLAEGGIIMTHEAKQLAFSSIFFDRAWWAEALGCEAPGLIGAGTGLPVGISRGSGLGYVVKHLSGEALPRGFAPFCGDPTQDSSSSL